MNRFQRFMRSLGFMVTPFHECKRPENPVSDPLLERIQAAKESLPPNSIKPDRVRRQLEDAYARGDRDTVQKLTRPAMEESGLL